MHLVDTTSLPESLKEGRLVQPPNLQTPNSEPARVVHHRAIVTASGRKASLVMPNAGETSVLETRVPRCARNDKGLPVRYLERAAPLAGQLAHDAGHYVVLEAAPDEEVRQ